jgi:hypothetical protein
VEVLVFQKSFGVDILGHFFQNLSEILFKYLVTLFATLGDVTRNRNDPICVALPNVAKVSTVTCLCRQHYRQQMSPM